MSQESTACCMVCQMTFSTHEELFAHSCAQIKAEKPEPEDDNQIEKDENLLETFVQQDFKYDMDPQDFSESDSVYTPKKKKIKKEKESRHTKVVKKKEKIKSKKKPSKNDEYVANYPKQTDMAFSNSNLQLSEEFIIFILKQVDELCESIKNGDPDLERVIEVHQGLNNVMSCYRNTLSSEKQFLIKSEDQEHYNLDEHTVLDNGQFEEAASDNDYVPEVQKGKKKRGRSRNAVTDKTYELVKNQCGRHSLTSMSFMLNINSATLKNRIKSDGLTFTEKKDSCEFCDMNKSIDNIDQDLLFLFMKYDTEYKFGCILCDFTAIKRGNLSNHIKSMHQSEINASKCKKFETKDDCGNSACKDLYGITKGKRFWCIKCTETTVLQKPGQPELEDQPRLNKPLKLCPECGISIQNLKIHLDNVHFGEKQICPHCSLELSCLRALKEHVKKVHEKIPCAECGKMVGPQEMGRHMQSHMPDELKKYKCDICGKGFPTNQHFKNHRNIHTGEKPYKCKSCNKGFAQKITLNSHIAAVHEGKKPHLCTLCGKAWAESGNLKKHIDMVHKGIKRVMKKDKNHKCTICNASFYQNSALKLHIAGIHEGKKPYTCNLCGVSFAWKNNLTKHIDGVHRGIKKQPKKKIQVFEQNKNKNLKEMQY